MYIVISQGFIVVELKIRPYADFCFPFTHTFLCISLFGCSQAAEELKKKEAEEKALKAAEEKAKKASDSKYIFERFVSFKEWSAPLELYL